METEIIPINDTALAKVESGSLQQITRAEIDCQIATAHQFPRSIAKFLTEAKAMVSIDEETAASCFFVRPVGMKNGQPEYAEGMSIRLAEIVAACYGNIRCDAFTVESTPRYVKARGMAHDLEKNVAMSSEVKESTVTKDGKPFSERMRVVVEKAALAKARRDAIFRVIPKSIARPLERLARQVALGDVKTLQTRRNAAIEWATKKLNIPEKRIFAALSVKGADEIGLEELSTLTGLRTGIISGEITPEEAFPVESAPASKPKFDLDGKPADPALSAATPPKTGTPATGESVPTTVPTTPATSVPTTRATSAAKTQSDDDKGASKK